MGFKLCRTSQGSQTPVLYRLLTLSKEWSRENGPWSRDSHMSKQTAQHFEIMKFLIFLFVFVVSPVLGQYKPTWESIDSRPLPSWYDESKLGIFVHWGVFSVPSFSSEWFWHDWKLSKLPGIEQFMKDNYKPDFTYADFAKDFSTEFFIADQWARLFNSSGAR